VVVRRGRRELRIDGTHASSYRPGSDVTGSVWDAIAAALLALPGRPRPRVALLGLGGGSAARVVRAVAPDAEIVGVEIDPQVVDLAREWFGLDALDVEVVLDDAARFLARTRRRFDAVLEDVFVGNEQNLHKPPGFPEPALLHAVSRLRPGGVLASNTLDEEPQVRRTLCACFQNRVRIEVDGYDNRILLGSDGPLSGRSLRSAVQKDPVLGATAERLFFTSF
jgi:spermidine synthase